MQLRQTADVSVVDATAGQTAEQPPTPPAVILRSDAGDMTRLAGTLGGDVRVIGV